MLSNEEKKELEELKSSPYVKLAIKSMRAPVDPEKKKLYQYRWLKKKGMQIAEELECQEDEE